MALIGTELPTTPAEAYSQVLSNFLLIATAICSGVFFMSTRFADVAVFLNGSMSRCLMMMMAQTLDVVFSAISDEILGTRLASLN